MALKGFEKHSFELTEYELETLVPMVVAKISEHRGKVNAIQCPRLEAHVFDCTGRKISHSRVRKIIEHIRHNQLVEGGIAANVKGYYVPATPEELQEWLNVMRQRRNVINVSISSGEKALRILTGTKQPNQYKRRKADPAIKQTTFFQ